jgi:hypothetical protein
MFRSWMEERSWIRITQKATSYLFYLIYWHQTDAGVGGSSLKAQWNRKDTSSPKAVHRKQEKLPTQDLIFLYLSSKEAGTGRFASGISFIPLSSSTYLSRSDFDFTCVIWILPLIHLWLIIRLAQAASSYPFPDQDPRLWLVSFPYVGPDPCSACMIPSFLLWALFPCRIRFLCSIRILFRALTLLDRCQGQAWIIHLSLTIYRFQMGIHRCWYHPFPL